MLNKIFLYLYFCILYFYIYIFIFLINYFYLYKIYFILFPKSIPTTTNVLNVPIT